MSEETHPYVVYAIDPNGDDQMLGEAFTLNSARRLKMKMIQIFHGSGCRVEILRDGEFIED